MVINAPFVGRVEKGFETSVYITESAILRILVALTIVDNIILEKSAGSKSGVHVDFDPYRVP